jgi:hypothetical protein
LTGILRPGRDSSKLVTLLLSGKQKTTGGSRCINRGAIGKNRRPPLFSCFFCGFAID